jgi:hypothetical protein
MKPNPNPWDKFNVDPIRITGYYRWVKEIKQAALLATYGTSLLLTVNSYK